MARLNWGEVGTRLYEGGIDRGVFYLGTDPGVPWNGLRTVSEGASAPAPRPFYLDGIKYLNLSTSADFEATITAFAAPEGFDACVGRVSLAAGLFATEQRRLPFSFTYRTLIGNDDVGIDFGHKIHIVYNAMATPAQVQRNSLGGQTEPANLSWNITTVPPIVSGIRPTAHYIVDSRLADPTALQNLEDILYGDASNNSRLPDVAELISILGG